MQIMERTHSKELNLFGEEIQQEPAKKIKKVEVVEPQGKLSEIEEVWMLNNIPAALLSNNDDIFKAHRLKVLGLNQEDVALGDEPDPEDPVNQGEMFATGEFKHGFNLLDAMCWVFDLYGEPSAISFVAASNEAGRSAQKYQERIAATMKTELTDLVLFVLAYRGPDSARRIVMKLADFIDLYHLLPESTDYH